MAPGFLVVAEQFDQPERAKIFRERVRSETIDGLGRLDGLEQRQFLPTVRQLLQHVRFRRKCGGQVTHSGRAGPEAQLQTLPRGRLGQARQRSGIRFRPGCNILVQGLKVTEEQVGKVAGNRMRAQEFLGGHHEVGVNPGEQDRDIAIAGQFRQPHGGFEEFTIAKELALAFLLQVTGKEFGQGIGFHGQRQNRGGSSPEYFFGALRRQDQRFDRRTVIQAATEEARQVIGYVRDVVDDDEDALAPKKILHQFQ